MAAVQCLCICLAALYVGELVTLVSKARIPSVFVTALLFMIGFWTIIPKDLVSQAGVTPSLASVAIALCLLNLGSTFSLKDLAAQWRAALITILGMAAATAGIMVIGALFLEKNMLIVGVPSFLGTVVAALIMQAAAEAQNMANLGVFAIVVFVLQGFVGYPLLSLMIRKESKRLLSSGELETQNLAASAEIVDKKEGKKKLRFGRGGLGDLGRNTSIDSSSKQPRSLVKQVFSTTYARYFKLLFVGSLAYASATLTGMLGFEINAFVLCLVYGVLARTLGFFENNELELAGGQGLAITFVMVYIFDGLSKAAPDVVLSQIVPFIIVACCGLFAMLLACVLIAKALKVSWYFALGCAVNCLIGYPGNYTIVKEITQIVTDSPEKQQALEHKLLPPTLVSGFISVSTGSVIVAGIFAQLLH